MSLINVREKTIQAKIVYYGTGLSGKTTSLKHVHRVIDPDHKVELVSLNTEGDRTFFFDFLPIPLGSVNGYQVKLQAFTVPGQVKYNLTRRYVLRGADAVIFVADSLPTAFDDNLRSMESLVENLRINGLDPTRTPVVVQYNKRDAPGALPVERLRAALNAQGNREHETIATSGAGVFEAFTDVCCAVAEQLAKDYRVGDSREARENVGKRLRAAQAGWRPPAADASAQLAAAGSAQAGERSQAAHAANAEAGLAAVEGVKAAAVVEVSSLEVPDLPDAETLLRHAVDTNIESARLVSELTETKRRLADHVRQLAALHQTGVVLASELDGDRLLGSVLVSALRTVDAEHGSILLLADDGRSLRPKLVHGFLHDPLLADVASSPDVTERVLAGRPFHVDLDTSADGGSGTPMAALVAPLTHQSTVLGALTAYVLDRPMDQDLRHRLRFLAAVASQAAVGLVNSRLVGRIEAFNRELERKVDERTRELANALAELRVLDRLKDDFLASMSHELLTPLQSIASAGEILTSVAGEDGPAAAEDRREFAGVVQRESVRLTGMLRAVLELSQFEAGKVDLELEELDLREVVIAAHQRRREEFHAAESRLKVRVEEGMPRVTADPDWVGRVLDALLSNAVKFGARGQEVGVTIRREGAAAVVEVRDRGAGVPEALRASVFEKFKQVGDILTDKPAGLGLGLPTARLLVEKMGGRIWHEPGAGSGSVFIFTLPVAVPAAIVA